MIITDRGKKVLKENLSLIDVSYLRQFPEFCEFQNLKREKSTSAKKIDKEDLDENQSNNTPSEQLESIYQTLQSNLKQDLLENIMKCEAFFFERLVVDLLINLGYGGSKKSAGQAFTTTHDGGIDGVIKEDKLGLDKIYIQAKRWDSGVGRPEIQKFAGALQGKRAKKGVFITTSQFSKDAKEFVNNLDSKIILIDGDSLTDYMIESNTGVLVENKYEIKKIDSNYFEDED